MRITYDPDADAMYIYFKECKVDKTVEVNANTLIDYDAEGNIVGIEFLFVKERNPHLLEKIRVESPILA